MEHTVGDLKSFWCVQLALINRTHKAVVAHCLRSNEMLECAVGALVDKCSSFIEYYTLQTKIRVTMVHWAQHVWGNCHIILALKFAVGLCSWLLNRQLCYRSFRTIYFKIYIVTKFHITQGVRDNWCNSLVLDITILFWNWWFNW